MHRVSGWIRLHVTWAITLSLLGVLLLGSGVWLFIRTTTHSVHGVLVTGPAFVALLERETGKPIWRHRTNLNCHQTGITACAPLETNGLVYVLTQTGYATLNGVTSTGVTSTLEARSFYDD